MLFYVGVDLGQRQDHTAIVVVERLGQSKLLVVRWVERVPLGTPYVRVVERLKEIVRNPELFGRVRVAVDGGSIGSPVMEMIWAGVRCGGGGVDVGGEGAVGWAAGHWQLVHGAEEGFIGRGAGAPGEAGTAVREGVAGVGELVERAEGYAGDGVGKGRGPDGGGWRGAA